MGAPRIRRHLAWLLAIVVVAGCNTSRNDIEIDIEEVDQVLVLSINNNLTTSIGVHDRMFELGTTPPPRIDIQLLDQQGTSLRACSAVQYTHPLELVEIPPGTTFLRRIDLAYVKGAFCAKAGHSYFVRVRLLDGSGVLDRRSKPSNLLPIVFKDQRNPRS